MAQRVPMVKLLISIPLAMRTELEIIRQRDGVSISQQARYSLGMWIRRASKDPAGAWGMIGNVVHQTQKGTQSPPEAPGPSKPFDPGPEPDQHNDPVAWSKWSAKAGNAAIARLAKGEWPEGDE